MTQKFSYELTQPSEMRLGEDHVFVDTPPENHWPEVLRKMGYGLGTGPSFLRVREAVNEGLERAAFDNLRDSFGVTAETMARVTRIPMRTLSRRNHRFKPEESERILRVAGVFQSALECLDSPVAARRWLNSPKMALAGLTPLECCDTEAGAREVEQLLLRLEYGVFV
jgi:putative toxin-antitoxin system antitoxin component (TIGR02293 family)